eukprot:403342606
MLNDVFVFDIEESTWNNLEFSNEDLNLNHPKPRSSHAVALDSDFKDRFYMFGGTGINLGQSNFSDLWVFDFRSQKFREISQSKINKPHGMYGHTLNYYKNSLYLFGGTNGFEYYNDLLRFDLLYFQWQKVVTVKGSIDPEPRYKHSAVMISDENKLIILGGTNQNKRFGNIYEFSFDKKAWSLVNINKNKQIFKGRYGHSTDLVSSDLKTQQNHIIIFGGLEDRQKNDLIRFDLNSGNFNLVQLNDIENIPSERDFHSSVLFENQLYIIGCGKTK